ncbi:MAG TPA: hypothetical protein VFF88_06705 [Methylocella sp.]|nr:hypothetical protein [Methylocella sp.]
MSYGRLALMYKQGGDKTKARALLQQGRGIMVRLTELSPDHAEWKKDLAKFDARIAELAER